MVYASGATASFDVGMDSPLTVWLVANGSRGSLQVPNPYQPSWETLWEPAPCPTGVRLNVAGQETIFPTPGESPFLHEVEDFSRLIRGDGGYVVPTAETVTNMRTIARLLEAVRR